MVIQTPEAVLEILHIPCQSASTGSNINSLSTSKNLEEDNSTTSQVQNYCVGVAGLDCISPEVGGPLRILVLIES
jgi:hypothetical protein